MMLKILSPGPLSTIQDGGRFGYMCSGFGSGGAMDLRAMQIANILVGNLPDDGVIEMTMLGISAQFTCPSIIALTGADMQPRLNGKKIPMYQSVPVQPGDQLTMAAAKSGMRCYLAVAGGDLYAICPLGRGFHRQPIPNVHANMARKPHRLPYPQIRKILRHLTAIGNDGIRILILHSIAAIDCTAIVGVNLPTPAP